MIPVKKEPKDFFENFRVYEHCYFCQIPTNTWHLNTNQPVCRSCAKIHNINEIKPCVPNYKPKNGTQKSPLGIWS